MADAKQRKVIQLTLNNEFIDKIMKEMEIMKTNHNKIIKISSGDKSAVFVMTHVNNKLNKKEAKPSENKSKET